MAALARRWQLRAADAYTGIIAADGRLAPVDLSDDFAWEARLGEGGSTALSFSTRFAGRIGVTSVAPRWMVDSVGIGMANEMATPLALTRFAPGYLRFEGELVPALPIMAELWVADSHTVSGRFSLTNRGPIARQVEMTLVTMAASASGEAKLSSLPAAGGGAALAFRAGELRPVVYLADGVFPEGFRRMPIVQQQIAPEQVAVFRWSCAALADPGKSQQAARQAAALDYLAVLNSVADRLRDLPDFDMGDADFDALLAFSVQQLMQSFLSPVREGGTRFAAERGVRPVQGGRSWGGAAPPTLYLSALAAAHVDPPLAAALVRTVLAGQQPDGTILTRPAATGRASTLMMPVLARLSWSLFQITEDESFLREVYPQLGRFFERWLAPDLDVDGDGLPEWQNEAQTGYPLLPMFAAGLPWGQNADIQQVESADLPAYLLSEAVSLREMAFFLRDSSAEQYFDGHIARLNARLETLWKGGRYVYQDRDTHDTGPGRLVLDEGRGGETQFIALDLTPPGRLLITVLGGQERAPQCTLTVRGVDADGGTVALSFDASELAWSHSRGTLTTPVAFSRVDTVDTPGLSALYRVRVRTVDTTAEDITGLIPLWSVAAPRERLEAVSEQMRARFLRANGVAMTPDLAADAPGAQAVWPFWQTILAEGLLELGDWQGAAALCQRLMRAQAVLLRTDKALYEAVAAEGSRGVGDRGHIGGAAPLHLLMRVLGIRIVSRSRVWAGGPFVWEKPVTVRRCGVEVRRSAEGTVVRFPSGLERVLPPDAPFMLVEAPELREAGS